MTATTQDRNTPFMDGELFQVPVAAGVLIPAGTIVCANAAGYAEPGSTDATQVYLGRADDMADNRTGTDGALMMLVRRGKAYQWANDPADAVTQASVGRDCFVSDNQTVSKTDGGGARPRAGTVLGVSADGVWVI